MPRRKASNELRARIFNALSDPDRLRILEALIEKVKEGKAGDIVRASKVSREDVLPHLGELRKAQLVAVRRIGPYNYYRVVDAKAVDRILEAVDNYLVLLEELRRKGMAI